MVMRWGAAAVAVVADNHVDNIVVVGDSVVAGVRSQKRGCYCC